MTVQTDTARADYTGNGSTTEFPVPFRFLENSHLLVIRTVIATGVETTLVLDSGSANGYTVAGAGQPNGGSVTVNTAPANNTEKLSILLDVPITQLIDYIANDPFPAETHERGLDKLTMIAKSLAESISRCLKLPASLVGTSSSFPSPDALKGIRWNAGATGLENYETSSIANPGGSALVGFQQAGTGSVLQTVQDKLRERVSAADFGAVGSGEESGKLQAAIDYLDTLGGGDIVLKRGGAYQISTKLRAKTAVKFVAEVKAEVSSNANGGGAAKPSLTWTGAYTAGAMYEVKANSAGDIVFGGGVEDVFFDGGDNIDYAVHLNNTAGATAIIEARRVRIAGILSSSQNGNASSFSQRNTLAIHFVYGVTGTVAGAHGISIEGAAGNIPATQNRVLYANGLVKNGYMVKLGAMVDNCILHEVRAAVDAGGTGGGWQCAAAGGMTYGAESNLCLYLVGKWDTGDTSSNNNRVLHYISEGGTIAGTATWHGELFDYSTYKAFTSHKYALRKKYNITPGMVLGDGTTGTAKFGLQWLCPTFLLGGTGSMCVVVPPDYEVLNGVIESIEVWIGTNGTSAGNYRMQVVFSTVPIGAGGVVVPDQTVTSTVAAPAQYNIAKYTFDLSPDVAMATDDALYLQINRLAADAADTNTEDSIFLGARILFKATGPDSGGSGTYVIPSW